MTGTRIKFLVFIVLLILAVWSLYPTYRLYREMPAKERSLLKEKERILATTDSASIHSQMIVWERSWADFVNERNQLAKRALHLGLDIQGGMNLTLTIADTVQIDRDRITDALRADMKVIEGRIDRLGVVEPMIQLAGDRLIVQLPGVVDQARAESLIGKTAVLDFRILADDRITENILNRADNFIKAQQSADSANASSFRTYISSLGGDLAVDEQYYSIVAGMIAQLDTTPIMGEYRFFFGPKERGPGGDARRLYLLRREPELSTADGKLIDKAYHRIYSGTDDPQASNTFIVDFTLSRTPNNKYNPVNKFAAVTQRFVNKRLAIVLDSVVQSAPVIRSKIPDGSGMITTGDIQGDKARDLAIVLATGSLQAPLKIESSERIGPSLGQDSIRRGIQASLLGALLVVLFIAIYYNLSGLNAILALSVNMLFLFAILGGVLHATMSLPGLAGLALTVGMAVDSNVLIMERIREELRWGKSPRVAVENGYARVLPVLLDANLTTILASVSLYLLGSGPIRGFATTLIIGLVINFLTAIYVTRMVYDLALEQFQIKTLRI